MFRRLSIAVLALGLVVGGCARAGSATTPEHDAAVVAGHTITVGELNDAVALAKKTVPQTLTSADTALLTQSVLTSLIRTHLMLDGAQRSGYSLTQSDIDRAVAAAVAQSGQPGETLESILLHGNASVPNVADATTPAGVDFSIGAQQVAADLLVKAALAHPDQYVQYHVRHVLVHTLAQAQHVRALLLSGHSWDSVAGTYSIDTGSKGKGGDLGDITRGETVAPFEHEVLKLAKQGSCATTTNGDCASPVSEPVHSQFGWHVIQVIGLATPTASSLRTQLAGQSYATQRTKAFSSWFDGVAQGEKVTVNGRFGEWAPSSLAVVPRSTAPSSPASVPTTTAATGG